MTARHLTASAAVIDPRTRTVLLVRKHGSRVWQFPGGHLEKGESLAEAAVREVLEETGVHADLSGARLDLPGMVWQPSPILTAVMSAPAKLARPGKPAEDAHEHIDYVFPATGDSTAPVVPEPAEVAEVVWQSLDALGDLPDRAEVPMVAAFVAASIGLERVSR